MSKSREALRRLGADFCCLCAGFDEPHAALINVATYNRLAERMMRPRIAVATTDAHVKICPRCLQAYRHQAGSELREQIAQNERTLRQEREAREALKAMDRASSASYRKAVSSHRGEIALAQREWGMGGGIFGSGDD